jgi:hypothetical protein
MAVSVSDSGRWSYDPDADQPQGVWMVWSTTTRESLHIVFPADQELECRRWSDEQGYGWVEFVAFGEQL